MSRPSRPDSTSVLTIVLALGCALLGIGWSGWRDELRAQGYYYYSGAITFVTGAGSDLDIGWTGIAHNASGLEGAAVTIACPNIESCSCVLDGSDLVGSPLGAPLPISAGGVPICVIPTVREPITGDFDCATGCMSARVQLATRFFLTPDLGRPCPTCVGDPTPGDGAKDGFCDGGATPGDACDVGGAHPEFGDTSNDCLPSGSSVGEPDIDLNPLTTGSVSLPASFDCLSASYPPGSCHCPNQVQPHACLDGVCPESGVCENGPIDGVCSDATFRQCRSGTGTEDCEDVFPGSGSCIDQPRPCFGHTITRTGECGTESAVLTSIFCLAPTRAPAINVTLGLPGPVAITVPVFAVPGPGPTPTPVPSPGSTPTPAGPCSAAPRAGCRQLSDPEKSVLLLQDAASDRRDELAWRWMAGDATPAAAFGDPRTTEGYALCIYAGGVPTLALTAAIPAARICKDDPCWRQTGADGGFTYRDGAGGAAGVKRLALEPGEHGKTKITLKGRGTALPMPKLPLTLPLTVQLQATNGECWEAAYGESGVKRNDGKRFRATSGP